MAVQQSASLPSSFSSCRGTRLGIVFNLTTRRARRTLKTLMVQVENKYRQMRGMTPREVPSRYKLVVWDLLWCGTERERERDDNLPSINRQNSVEIRITLTCSLNQIKRLQAFQVFGRGLKYEHAREYRLELINAGLDPWRRDQSILLEPTKGLLTSKNEYVESHLI